MPRSIDLCCAPFGQKIWRPTLGCAFFRQKNRQNQLELLVRNKYGFAARVVRASDDLSGGSANGSTLTWLISGDADTEAAQSCGDTVVMPIAFQDLELAFRNLPHPDSVLTPVFGQNHDVHDVARLADAAFFEGELWLFANSKGSVDLIRDEIAQEFPNLNILVVSCHQQ